MPTKTQYVQIRHCLEELSVILNKIGVNDFSISDKGSYITLHTDQEIDQALLDKFCTRTTEVYKEIKSGT